MSGTGAAEPVTESVEAVVEPGLRTTRLRLEAPAALLLPAVSTAVLALLAGLLAGLPYSPLEMAREIGDFSVAVAVHPDGHPDCRGDLDLVIRRQKDPDGLAYPLFVVDDQNPDAHSLPPSAPRAGSSTTKLEPRPSSDRTLILPPSALTRPWAMKRPTPVPPVCASPTR